METYDNGIESYTYSYDNMNITEIETAEGAISYEYDELDRLTGVFYPDGESIEYTYDTAGNRTSKTVTEIVDGKSETERITYSYDFSNRMTRAGDVRYEYDEKDRLVKKIDGGDTFEYSYNSLDQLISVEKNGAEVASFAYDLQGRRVSETINGEEKEYLWSGDSLLGEYSGNSMDRIYAVGNGVDEVLGIYDESGETQYLHSNHVGSVTGVTDESGSIAGEKEYTPFGLARETSGDVDTELGFIGRKQYEEIGLTYIRARFYEPASGRFITKDPVRDGFNWYSYCNGNPVNYVDPLGLRIIPYEDSPYNNNRIPLSDETLKRTHWLSQDGKLAEDAKLYFNVYGRKNKKNLYGDVTVSITLLGQDFAVGFTYLTGNGNYSGAKYIHLGTGRTKSWLPVAVDLSLSGGVVRNAHTPQMFNEEFINVSADCLIGIEHARTPSIPISKDDVVNSTGLVFSTTPGIGGRGDWYILIDYNN